MRLGKPQRAACRRTRPALSVLGETYDTVFDALVQDTPGFWGLWALELITGALTGRPQDATW